MSVWFFVILAVMAWILLALIIVCFMAGAARGRRKYPTPPSASKFEPLPCLEDIPALEVVAPVTTTKSVIPDAGTAPELASR